jgi:hypothetical protein
MDKVEWQGKIISIQPRIRLLRSFDEAGHTYLGYALFLDGSVDSDPKAFRVGIGHKAQEKHQLRCGDVVQGKAQQVSNTNKEIVEYYKVSGLKLVERSEVNNDPPPWTTVPPDIATYRERGSRRLAPRTYSTKCTSCIWGCKMPVEIIVDHWNPSKVKYRTETFCYGPKSCILYNAGPTRKVPGRNGMVFEEEDWIAEQATAHRDD